MILTKTKLDDAELVRLISIKSRVGAVALYDRYAKALMLVIICITPQKKIAESILEQTYIKACYSFENHTPEKQTVLSWMMNIAQNIANEHQSSLLRATSKINDHRPNPGLIKSIYI